MQIEVAQMHKGCSILKC